MAPPSPEPSRRRHEVDELRELPLDPDLDLDLEPGVDSWGRPAGSGRSEPAAGSSRRWPRIHWANVAAVGVGAFVGGLARYLVGLAWPAPPGTFPWGIFGVNTAGVFILALLLVLALEVLNPADYVRPMVGTGFCGGLTTFSSVATGVDELAAHGHPALAVGYVAASVSTGLAAAALGIIVGRSIGAARDRSGD